MLIMQIIYSEERIIKGKRNWNDNGNKKYSMSNENLSIHITDQVEDRIPGLEVKLKKMGHSVKVNDEFVFVCVCVSETRDLQDTIKGKIYKLRA